MTTLPPGSTIGIIGGGQLGRMLSIAAAQIGYRCHVFAPELSGPAADVCAKWVQGDYGDSAALAAFADDVDVVTFEFENVEPDPLRSIAAHAPLYPPIDALEIGQDRIREKTFAADCGARTADWAEVNSRADLDAAITKIGTPAILKTTRFGYDGKGQARLSTQEDQAPAIADMAGQAAILEGFISFSEEIGQNFYKVHYYVSTDEINEIDKIVTNKRYEFLTSSVQEYFVDDLINLTFNIKRLYVKYGGLTGNGSKQHKF